MSGSTPPANICRLVLKLDGHIKSDSLHSAIQESGLLEWLSNVYWSRPFPFMAPIWKVKGTKNRILIAEHSADEGDSANYLPSSVMSRTVSPFKPPAFAFDLIHHGDNRTTLAFTWHHALMDARGAEILITDIGHSDKNSLRARRPIYAAMPPAMPERLKMLVKMPQKAYFARKAIHAVVKACRPTIASLASGRPQTPGGQQLFRIISFDPDQTKTIENNCIAAGANFRKSLFYLAASIRALHYVMLNRGCGPASYVIPVPQDTRKRGSRGPVISNHVTFLFYRAEPGEVLSMKGLIRSLSNQMVEQIRNRIPESFTATMELFRSLPLGLFAGQVSSPTKGQIATFFFSFPGDTCPDLEKFLGVPVSKAIHLPPVSMPPGLSIIFNEHRGRLSAVLSFVEGCIDPKELDLLEGSIRKELLNEDIDAGR